MLKKMSEKVDDFVNKYNANISFLDKIGLENSIRLFEWLRRMLWIIPGVSWAIEIILTIVPAIKTLDRIYLFIELIILLALVANLIVSFIINRLLLYFNTRNTELDPYERTDKLWDIQKKGDSQQSITTGAIIALPFVFIILPYLEFLRQNPTIKGWTVAMTDELNGNPFVFRFLIMSIPILVTALIYEKMQQQERLHEQSINEWMSTFRYENKDLHSVLSGEPNNVGENANNKSGEATDPYIVIGKSIKTDDNVILPPANRKQNSVYFGPSGSGKSSTVFIPQIRQDIEHLLRYMRDASKIRQDPGYLKKRGNIATHYLNGIAVIETSNELCKQVYDMALAMGVPEDSIAYLDPTNEYSTGMNMLRGPTDTVVETMTNIIAGVKEGHKDFFAEAERTHLKHYILLLKFTAVMRNEIATFTDLTELYNDIFEVRLRQKDLFRYVNILKKKQAKAKKEYDADPQSKVLRARYEELFDKYKIADDTLQWFNTNIVALWQGKNPATYKSGPHAGEQMYADAQAQNVQGLKNTLDDLSKNKYLRRVLFRDTGFDLDSLLLNGGILLCNTAKAELKDQLSQRLGQMYLMSFQAATFRRIPDKVPMFALYADEFPDFVSDSFRSYIAQARKYGVATVVAAQSPSQLSLNNGQDFFNTLMSNMLTRGTFGDLGPEDARKLEPFFGQHTKVEENISEQEIELTADQADNRKMITARKTQEPNISANQIMALPPFTLALRHPSRQGSSMFDLIQAHYLTDEEIRNYPDKFDPDNNEADRKAYEAMIDTNTKVNPDFDEVDEEIIAELAENKEQAKSSDPLVATQELNISDDKDDYDSISDGSQTEGAEADDDLRKPRGNTPSNAENGADGQNESNKGQSIIFTAEDDDDAGPSAELTNNRVLDSQEIAQKKEEARKVARRAVHLSESHGGNDRLKNGVKTDNEIPKDNNQDSLTIAENVNATDIDTEKKAVTEDNMLVQKDNKLVVEKKDRENMVKIKQENDAAHAKELKKQLLDGLSQKLQTVANDPSITSGEKVSQLTELKKENIEDVKIICGQEVAEKVTRKIDGAIEKFRDQLNEPTEPIRKDDDLETIMAKSKSTGEKARAYEKQLEEEKAAKELDDMIDKFFKNKDTASDDEDSELEGITEQHGGDYE